MMDAAFLAAVVLAITHIGGGRLQRLHTCLACSSLTASSCSRGGVATRPAVVTPNLDRWLHFASFGVYTAIVGSPAPRPG